MTLTRRLPEGAGVCLMLLLGGVAAMGLAPNGYWGATILALSVLFAMVPRARRPALWLWAFGAGYFGVGLRWIVEPFQIEADVYGWMAPFALLGMAAGLALFWALAGGLAGRLGRGGTRRTAVALILCLSLAEVARAYVFTGFPWAGLAQIWIDTPLAATLALIGPQGLGLATLLLAGAGVLLVPERGLAVAGAPAILCLVLMPILPHPESPQPAPDAPVLRLVQPNAPQDEKWAPDKWQTFFWRQVDATQAAGTPAAIIWPETAIPSLLQHADEALDIIAEAAEGTPVVLGVQRRDDQLRYYNALIVTGAEGAVRAVYDKHHLVPFGEYMPFPGLFRRLGVQALAQRVDTGFAAGPGPRLVEVPGVGAALPLICYEAVFPHHANAPGARPRLLLQITNDAWFGTYAGPQQHLAQARMRAIEQGLPLARAANTGISAMIDGQGRVTAALALGEFGFIDAPLPPALPPTLYARTGDGPVAVLLLLALGAMLWWRRRGPAV